MSRMRAGRGLVSRLLLALVLGVGLMGAPGASELPGVFPGASFGPATVRAATPGLTIVAAARYDVRPAQHLVHITLDLTLTNRLQDTKTSRYYFDQAFLSVLPGTSGYRLTWAGSGTPSVSVSKKTTTYTLLRLGLAARIFGGQTGSYRLAFDLRDPGGSATRDLRVSDSLVSFPVWAFATNATSGSSSMVVFPAGYDVRVEAGSIPAPTTLPDGRTVFRTGALAEPLKFFAYLVADRPGSYRQATIPATVEGTPIQVVLRSWPDDRPWATRVSDLLRRGLPALGDAIGLPWSHTQPMTVQEALSRSTQGYAGLFDPNTNRVEIAYFADSFVVLHESAHGWFNGALLADRWANEAFASFYAEQAAAKLKIAVKPATLTPRLRAAAIPLNAWGPVGAAGTASEDYAYAASLQLAREIGKRAGLETLKKVWADAASHTGAYQPSAGPTETADSTVDWRGLLDLLEERTGTSFDDLWRTWVARPDDLALLDAREGARTKYAAVLAKTGGWALPKAIRDALRSWRFADATTLLDQASGALDQQAQVEAAATKAGLSAPAAQQAMRAAFENDATFSDVSAVAQAELKAVASYQRAVSMRHPVQTGDVITTFGMWGQTPDADLAAARDAFARGATDDSIAASNAAALAWADAEAIGRGRVLSLVLLLVAALLGLLIVVRGLNRRRRRRRHHAMMARRMREGSQIVD